LAASSALAVFLGVWRVATMVIIIIALIGRHSLLLIAPERPPPSSFSLFFVRRGPFL
jgi:hypothetical protein